jgi:biotin transport system substrate-specific component
MNKTSRKQNMKMLTAVGLMTAVLCVLGPIAFLLPFSPVPISLATFVIYLSLIVFDKTLSLLCVLVYLLIGFAGLPVFAQFTGGPGKLLGPTGGYLIGYLILTIIYALFTHQRPKESSADTQGARFGLRRILGLLFGTFACYLFGTLWLAHQLELPFAQALAIGVLPYLPADLLKMIAAYTSGTQMRKRLLKLGLLKS